MQKLFFIVVFTVVCLAHFLLLTHKQAQKPLLVKKEASTKAVQLTRFILQEPKPIVKKEKVLQKKLAPQKVTKKEPVKKPLKALVKKAPVAKSVAKKKSVFKEKKTAFKKPKKEVVKQVKKTVTKPLKKVQKLVKKEPLKPVHEPKKALKKEKAVVKKAPELTKELKKPLKKVAQQKPLPTKKEQTLTQKASLASTKLSAEDEKEKESYLLALRSAIEQNKRYPLLSKRFREQGVVKLKFRVLKNGVFKKIKVHESSGKSRLDKAALKAIEQTRRFKPLPKVLKKEFIDYDLSIRFQL